MKLAHWGRVLGPVGLMFLVVSFATIFLAGDTGLGLVNVGLGIACIAFYLVTNFGELSQAAFSRGTFYVVTSAVTTAVLVAGLVATNWLAVSKDRKWDVTENKIHSFSDDTLKTLQGLKEPVEVIAFFGNKEAEEITVYKNILDRYAHESDKFKYRFVDPDREPQLVKELDLRPGAPRVVVRLGKLDARVAAATEEELTNALVKVTHAVAKKVYVLVGHGEAAIDDKGQGGLAELAQRMENEGLHAEPLQLSGKVPDDAGAVLVAGPQKPLLPGEVELLRRYLASGGRVMLLVEPLTPTGVEPILRDVGITLDDGVAIDQLGRDQLDNPFGVLGASYSQHAIVRGFRLATAFIQAGSLSLGAVPDVQSQPLVQTLGEVAGQTVSWLERTPDASAKPAGAAKMGPLTLAAEATRAPAKDGPKRSDEGRLVVVADRDFATNGVVQALGNGDFALNCVNWLTDQAERIAIRPRQRTASRLFLTPAQLGGIRFFATELPIGLLGLGLAIFFNRRAK